MYHYNIVKITNQCIIKFIRGLCEEDYKYNFYNVQIDLHIHNNLHIFDMILSSYGLAISNEKIINVIYNIIKDEISWLKILVIFMLVKFIKKNLLTSNNMVDIVGNYISYSISNYIIHNGGWINFIEYLMQFIDR